MMWKTQPKIYTLIATLPLILGGIGVSAQVGAQSVTGCGKSYNVFDQFASITLNVDIIQGKAEEIQWHLENLDNLNVHIQRMKGNTITITNSHLDVGHHAVMASVDGRGAGSSQSMRFFQIVDTEQLPHYCKQYPPQLIDSCFTKWPFPETLPFRLNFQILNETGNFHRVQWNKQKACLSPRLIVDPLLKKKGQQEPVATFYMNLTLPMRGGTIDVEEEDGDICLPQTELKANSLYEATIYVNDSLMIDRETHKILLDRIVDTHFSIRIVRPLSAIETHSVTSFEHIVLSGVCEGFDCPQAAKRQWYVKAIYVNGSSWWLDDEEMNRFTQGRNTSTIIIAPELLLQLPEYAQLSTCLSPARLSPDEPDICVILGIRTPIPCNRCVLQSPSVLNDFQHVNASCSCPSAKGKFEFYAKTPDGEMTISVSEKPMFSSILPRLEGGIETCIRSLPGSTVYINTCFQTLQFVPVIKEDFKNLLQSIASGKLDILDNAVASGQPSVIFRIVHTISTQVTALMKSDFSEGSLECFNHTRNQAAKLLDKLVTALENISVTDGETLSMTSAIEALAANAKEVAFPTVERIQSRLAEVARVLPDILAASSRDNVLTVGHRFLHIGLHLLEGMSHQHASPTPYLRDRAPQSLDYDTDIDSPPLNRVDQLITRNLQEDQRKAATSMVRTLENINAALAQALQEILVPGGDPLQFTSDTIGTVCFARVGMAISACGGTEFSVQISDGRIPIEDGVIQASRLRRNFYDYFNDEHLGPQSNLVSFTLYVNGTAINMSNTSSSFVITLKKDGNVSSSIPNPSIGMEEQHLTLPDPVVAVDGSLVYQPLILHGFDVGNMGNTFVFQLHPTDIGACPQYLVAVRFVIPPNLRFDDGLGRYLWSMIPSSTTKCKPNGNGEEVLLNYAYYIDREVLVELKAEALKHTAHMKLRAEELSVLYIGYRQLTTKELDRYNSENPPPVPYPYIDQINNTARVSAFMPSCLHISPGGAEWRKDGCKVLPSSNLDEVICECTHLTTFGAASLHASPHADFPYITDKTDLTHFSICHTITDIAIPYACILAWHITRQIYKSQQVLNLYLLTMAVCLQIVTMHGGIQYIGKTSTFFIASTLLYNWLNARFGSNSVQISLNVHSN
ncbi:hypothetical protein ECG_03508 [Echinococcus granulosus]|nr:hypothetical protein ECG_03508 [Echinococcus granulosus]